MNPVFGIHVGNTRACLAIFKQDDTKYCVEVIANNAGDRVTPAIVTVNETEDVVGAACKSLMVSRWTTTVTYNKRMLDKESLEELSNGERRVTTVMHNEQLCYELPLDERTEYRTPSDIATCIYRSLYDIAKSAVPGEVGDISCVLMVPKPSSEELCFKVRSAAEAAGWDVMQVISESSAAVLGYNLLSDKEPPSQQTVLVYRVGGRTCDATIIDLSHGMITVLDTEVTEEANGKLLIHTLTKYLADEFYRKYKLDPNESHRALTKLVLAAENCLHVLSTIESANCFVESLCEGVDFSHTMSRARFDSLIFSFLPMFSKPIFTVLDRLNMTPDKVSTVLLCGGPLKIPRLKKYITDIFQNYETKVVPLPNGINFDEVLACGAAQQAGFINMEKMGDTFLPSRISIPVLEFPLTVQVEGADVDNIELPVGLPLPSHKTLTVRQPKDLVSLTFTQPDSQALLKGQVQLDKDILGSGDVVELTLEIDSENGIKVNVPVAPDEVKHFPVKMTATARLL